MSRQYMQSRTDTAQQDDALTPSRPRTAPRPRTGLSTLGVENQEIICAVSESRGVSPAVGLAFVNLDTSEAVLSQINDTQTYVKTVHKLMVFNPACILIVASAVSPKSKLLSILEDSLEQLECNIVTIDRRYYSEAIGLEYIEALAFPNDIESVKTSVYGNYYAVCCFAAALKYVELALSRVFQPCSLRIHYEPSEGSMMIDLSTIHALELVQNLRDRKSKDCLFGLLNQSLTPMGARLLRSNILQPLTSAETLKKRYEAVEELSTKEDMFSAVRQALKGFTDIDKVLTRLILIPLQVTIKDSEQATNNVIMLKQFVNLVRPLYDSLSGAKCEMLRTIASICEASNTEAVRDLIDEVINEDTTYARAPLDLRNQRTYAVKAGVNGLLDVARQTYKESMQDSLTHISEVADAHKLPMQAKFDNVRQFFFRLNANEMQDGELPSIFINVYRRKGIIECQTLDLIKQNIKTGDAHVEVLLMSDHLIQDLISACRHHMQKLFKICESIALLDMLASFSQLVCLTPEPYIRPHHGDNTLAIRAGRHPIREKIHNTKFVPNDVHATHQTRFQIITGANMSGKSTYIRTVALFTVMAQVGSFVPAEFASLPIVYQLFARVNIDDSIEANVSVFAAEMREAAFILKNIDHRSIAIIDELGRGTSTGDGLAIALAIAEALMSSRAKVWFATHFRELAEIMAERSGVANLYLKTDMEVDDRMEMKYRITTGTVQEEHYGLRLAKIIPLPEDVIKHAELVASTLEQQTKRRNRPTLVRIQAKRRRLILNLKEHLLQAQESDMSEQSLKEWLRELQQEFVKNMLGLEEEAKML